MLVRNSAFTDDRFFAKRPGMEYVFIFCAGAGQLITQSAITNAMTHMYQMRNDFNDAQRMLPWYVASFGLSLGSLTLISGRVGDAYGIRNALIGGYIWTVIWSILCGISWYDKTNGSAFYICCRACQGAGVAFILPNILGAVGRIYKQGTLRERLVFGYVGFCAPLGGFLGAFFSGLIAVRTPDWYWNYYAYAILVLFMGVLSYVCVPELPPVLAESEECQSLDLMGGVLAMTSLTLFNFSWNQAPVKGWGSPYIITLLVMSVPISIAFVWWELKYSSNPLMPPEVLTSRDLSSALLVIILGWSAFGTNLFHFFTFLQGFRHYSPFAAGAGLAPAPFAGLVAAISFSYFIGRDTQELILFGSMLAFLASSIILSTAKINESYFRNTMGMWIIAPFGMSWSFPAVSIILSEGLPPKFQGVAGSLATVSMNYGISMFLGVAGTIEQQLLNQRPDDIWRAWRSAVYFNTGLSGLASLISCYFAIRKLIRLHKCHYDDVGKKQFNDGIDKITGQTHSTKTSADRETNYMENIDRDSISILSV